MSTNLCPPRRTHFRGRGALVIYPPDAARTVQVPTKVRYRL